MDLLYRWLFRDFIEFIYPSTPHSRARRHRDSELASRTRVPLQPLPTDQKSYQPRLNIFQHILVYERFLEVFSELLPICDEDILPTDLNPFFILDLDFFYFVCLSLCIGAITIIQYFTFVGVT